MSVKKLDDSKLSARAKAASVALAEIQRAVRFFRLYPHDHPLCTGAVDEALERLNRFLERQGALEVEVQRDGLYLDDELVLRDSDQSTDLSALLFPEGIREVSFDPGLPRQELFDFTQILSAHYPEGTEDISFTTDVLTELWRRDFAHIEYRIYDQLAPSSVKVNRDPTVAPVADRIVDLVDELSGAGKGGPGQDPVGDGLDVERFLAELEQAAQTGALDELANWATRPEKVDEFLGSSQGAARRALLLELSDPHQGDPLGRALDVVVWAAPAEEAAPAPDDVARFVAGSTLAALARGDVERATATLARLPGGPQGEAIGGAVTARLGTDQSLALLATALDDARRRTPGDALVDVGVRYLSRLDRAAVDGACQLYATLEQDAVRRVFREFLAAHVDDAAEAIAAITRAEDRRVVEEAATLLASRGRDSRAWKLLQDAAGDTLHPVRGVVAQDVIDTVTGEKLRRERVRTVTQGADKAARLEALEALAAGAGPRLFDDLAALALEAEFAQRDEDECRAVLDLLVRLGGLRCVRVLTELSQRRSLLFGRRDAAKVAALAQERLEALREHRP